ncbi:MAG TPA: hypothetical protein VES01_01180 [Dermatophilaceae bacterium]|nr:hypothetical protein [Dermatophilaceae bacterium]
MSSSNLAVRSMHDLGLAAWFGGSLMGATGLNGATSQAVDPRERLSLSSIGWKLWTPWQIGAIGVHAIGGVGLFAGNRHRLMVQEQARTNSAVKTVLTVAAAGVTAYSGMLGRTVEQHQEEGALGATEPGVAGSDSLSSAQRQLKLLQWAVPVLTGALIILGAQQGEQQRSSGASVDARTVDPVTADD